jgi:glycosyltransferase involved in cell wall biosynthesis
MKPLIMHIRASNFFGGPERQIIGHLTASSNAANRVLTFVERGAPNAFRERCIAEGIKVNTIFTQNPFALSVIKAIRNVFKETRPDIICSHGYKPTILTLLARVGLGIPLIIFSRGRTGENVKIRLFEFLERMAMRFAVMIVPVSDGQGDELMRAGLARKRMRVVRNAINVGRMETAVAKADIKRQEMGFAPDDILIATSGRLSPEKAQKDLITAFSIISSRHPKARLLIVGDGPLKNELEQWSREKGLSQVHFLGFRGDMDEIMAAIDLFVLPSLTEGLPNVILEAFACAKPVVATNVGGVPEVVTHGENGLLVKPGHPALLAIAMEKCLKSPETAKIMGEKGFRKVLSEFTFASQAKRLEQIYFEVIGHTSLKRADPVLHIEMKY